MVSLCNDKGVFNFCIKIQHNCKSAIAFNSSINKKLILTF